MSALPPSPPADGAARGKVESSPPARPRATPAVVVAGGGRGTQTSGSGRRQAAAPVEGAGAVSSSLPAPTPRDAGGARERGPGGPTLAAGPSPATSPAGGARPAGGQPDPGPPAEPGKRAATSYRGDELGAFELSRAKARDAALVIASRARDAGDCRLLLEICGLTGEAPWPA
jgi:hypothetical protein